MSTDSRRSRARQRRSRAFTASFAVVVSVLAAIGLVGAAVTTAQGPRVTAVQVDPRAATTASGSRLILTTTQSLAPVDAAQVTVTPATPFTVDTAGRSVGIRFALPLWDDTAYTVRIDGVTGVGGGPTGTLEESFTTPPLEVFLLQRGDAGDTIFRTDLTGTAGVPVVSAAHIEDFRETASHLVVSTVDDDGLSHLIVTDLAGKDQRELPLPGDGTVTNLQSADRGELIGYTFTDADIGAAGGRESLLFTTSLAGGRAPEPPRTVAVAGGDPRVDDWRFVPGTDSVLMLTFDGALTLVSTSGGAPVALGNAIGIDGIARGSTHAIVARATGLVVIDLATADERPLAETDAELGETTSVVALPTGIDAGAETGVGTTLRTLSVLDGFTLVSTQAAVVDADGSARTVFTLPPEDALVHTCVSPSGRYAAFTVAPDLVDNPYDGYLLPLPHRLQTHVVALADGGEVVALSGFDPSWCQSAPRG